MQWDDIDDPMDKPQVNPERDNITGNHPEIVDEIAVERRMNGERVPLNRAELSDAIATLTRMGYSAQMIATRLGVSDRLVTRYRTRGAA